MFSLTRTFVLAVCLVVGIGLVAFQAKTAEEALQDISGVIQNSRKEIIDQSVKPASQQLKTLNLLVQSQPNNSQIPVKYESCKVLWNKLFISEGGPVTFSSDSKYAFRMTAFGELECRELPSKESNDKISNVRAIIHDDAQWLKSITRQGNIRCYDAVSISGIETKNSSYIVAINLTDRLELFQYNNGNLNLTHRFLLRIPLGCGIREVNSDSYQIGPGILRTRTQNYESRIPTEACLGSAFSADKKMIAMLCDENGRYLLTIYDFQTGNLLHTTKITGRSPEVIGFDKDNRIVFPHQSQDDALTNNKPRYLYDWQETKTWKRMACDVGPSEEYAVALSSDCQLIALVKNKSKYQVMIFRTADMRLLALQDVLASGLENIVIESRANDVHSSPQLRFSADSRYLAFSTFGYVEFIRLDFDNSSFNQGSR